MVFRDERQLLLFEAEAAQQRLKHAHVAFEEARVAFAKSARERRRAWGRRAALLLYRVGWLICVPPIVMWGTCAWNDARHEPEVIQVPSRGPFLPEMPRSPWSDLPTDAMDLLRLARRWVGERYLLVGVEAQGIEIDGSISLFEPDQVKFRFALLAEGSGRGCTLDVHFHSHGPQAATRWHPPVVRFAIEDAEDRTPLPPCEFDELLAAAPRPGDNSTIILTGFGGTYQRSVFVQGESVPRRDHFGSDCQRIEEAP